MVLMFEKLWWNNWINSAAIIRANPPCCYTNTVVPALAKVYLTSINAFRSRQRYIQFFQNKSLKSTFHVALISLKQYFLGARKSINKMQISFSRKQCLLNEIATWCFHLIFLGSNFGKALKKSLLTVENNVWRLCTIQDKHALSMHTYIEGVDLMRHFIPCVYVGPEYTTVLVYKRTVVVYATSGIFVFPIWRNIFGSGKLLRK